MKTIGFGIIGIGRQGLRLAEHIRKDIKHAKLVAVCRRSEAGHDYSNKHGIIQYTNYHDMLANKEVDAVIITTPSNLHGVHAIDALKAGKHLLIDKPIASTVEEAEQIMVLANKEGLTVGLNFPLRVSPITKALKSNLDKIGELRKIQVVVSHGPIRCEWQSDISLSNGGVILDLGSHHFDLISYLTEYQPEAINNAYSEAEENENSGFIDLAYNNFDASMVLLRNQKFKKNIITFAGDKGFLFADYSGREVIISTDHKINEIKCPISQDFEIILNNFVRTINHKENAIATAEDGLYSLKTALSVYEAIKTGKTFKI